MHDPWITAMATSLTVVGSAALYAASPNQSLFPRRKPVGCVVAGLLLFLGGSALFALGWGGQVAWLVTLSLWMTVSVALPYLAAWRQR